MSKGKVCELKKSSVPCQVSYQRQSLPHVIELVIFLYPDPDQVFTVSFFENETGVVNGAQFTHENMTAGVAATRALLPLSHALTPQDTIVSAYSMSTAYGRAIAYTAIFEGTSLATLKSSKIYHVEERKLIQDIINHTSS